MNGFNDSCQLATNGDVLPSCSLTWSGSPIIDACTVCADYGDLLVLTEDGTLHGVDFASRICRALCTVDLPDTPSSEVTSYCVASYCLHAAADGRYVAIVVDRGQKGVVVEMPGGRVTMNLDGGNYHESTVPFSACFLRYEGRDVFVHRTAWNRLDAADPATGKSLTERDHLATGDDKSDPGHHLDYFHGALLASPDGNRLFDDGWVWHPVSIPRAWSVTEWLGSNPWESEDGASVVDLLMREDWGMPACWVSEGHIALWGLASWDEEEGQDAGHGPGVRILDVTTTERSPDSRWPMDIGATRVRNIFSDGLRLYVAAETGTIVWNISSRTQITAIPGFIARLHDPKCGKLIAVAPDRISVLQLPWSGVAF